MEGRSGGSEERRRAVESRGEKGEVKDQGKDGKAGADDDDTVARCANRNRAHPLIGGRLFLPPPLPLPLPGVPTYPTSVRSQFETT